MVSPHDSWEDVENGYENGDLGIFVEPSIVQAEEGLYYSTNGVPEKDANAYTVSFISGLGTGYGSHKSLVDFENPRTAWEYAHLATHYIEHSGAYEFAVSQLKGMDPDTGGWTPNKIVTDLGAEEVMRKMLGYYEFRLDDALKASGIAESE